MPFVKHSVEISRSPSTVFKALTELSNIREWAPVVVNSTSSDSEAKEGSLFSIEADLKPVGGPRFEFDNVVAELVKERRVRWRQTRGSMKKLEWLFELEPTAAGTAVNLTINYQMPYSIFGYIMDKLKMNMVIHSACMVNLEGLKRKLESSS